MRDQKRVIADAAALGCTVVSPTDAGERIKRLASD
jgi:hypothetical protein